ncbi:phosphonate transport system ATP-binding protein [Nitrobacteraceae bacterium AZCC 1564]
MTMGNLTSVREPILKIEQLSQCYGDRRVLDDLNLSVGRGEFVALIGPSGAGKTTLFKVITGLVSPDAGTLVFDGTRRLDQLRGRALRETRRDIGFIFQQFNLIKRKTALQNVLAGRLGRVPTWRVLLRRFSRNDIARAEAALAQVGLADFRHQRVDQLSGGQQQRVAIARAITQECRFILADEPVASLDPESAIGVMETLRDVANNQGIGVFCSLHQTDLALTYADRVIGLRTGRIVVDAATCDVTSRSLETIYGQSPRRRTIRSAARPENLETTSALSL